MQTQLNPYISFNGNAREAMEFYQSVFGGTLDLNTYKDSGASSDPTQGEKIMHAMLESGNGITFMASDAPDGASYNPGTNISMSLSGDNAAELTNYYQQLSIDGIIHEPLEKAPWGDTFGMFADKFGIEWMVNIAGPK